jgi:hypothetical protein
MNEGTNPPSAGEREGDGLTPETLLKMNEAGESYQSIADAFGTTRGTVAGLIYRHKRQIETQVDASEDDMSRWQVGVEALPSQYRLAFVSDLHIPDHDPRAYELALQIVRDFNPHIVTHGSDAFDFLNISRFEIDPANLVEDAWEGIGELYGALMSDLKSAAPNALTPFLMGNHDIRLYKFMTDKAPQMRKHVMKMFVSSIRRAGSLWLGLETDTLHLRPLVVKHGTIATQAAARANGLKVGWSRYVLTGHTHRFDLAAKTTFDQTIVSLTSGCLCNLKPAYRHEAQDWQQGITLVTVDRERGSCYMEPVVFSLDYSAVFGGKFYEVKRKAFK